MTLPLDDFHREVVTVALGVAARHGFVLGGGVAWLAHGLVARPTEDVDLFADADGAAPAAAGDVCAALRAAGFHVHDEPADDDLAALFDGFAGQMREFHVSRDGRGVRLTLARLSLRRSPLVLDVGPVMHLDDLIGSKVAALVNRREVRDYVDAAAALGSRGVDELLALGRQHDPALDTDDVAAAGRYLDRLPDSRFARYGLSPAQVALVRRRLAAWPRS
jgi:hypothetical protein